MGKEKTRFLTKCLHCDKEFETIPSIIQKGGGKFCSNQCRTTYRRKRVLKNCLQCEKEFETFPCEIKKGSGKFCSRSCATIYRNIHDNPTKDAKVREKISKNHADVAGQNNPMYGRRGKLSPGYIDGRKMYPGDRYKRILLASGEFPKCKLCGKCSGKIQVHHIDGNHENNEVSNLVFLCRKCHYNKAHTMIRDNKGRFLKQITNDLNL